MSLPLKMPITGRSRAGESGVKCSMNEVFGLCAKASRGAGIPWGLAEEAASAVRWLHEFGWPGADLLCGCLQDLSNGAVTLFDGLPEQPGGLWGADSKALFPIMLGTVVNDRAQRIAAGEQIEIKRVGWPLLVLPFVAGAMTHVECSLVLEWPGTLLDVRGHACVHVAQKDTLLTSDTRALCCRMVSNESPGSAALSTRRRSVASGTAVSQQTWEMLTEFARGTYVPASRHSRARGAGESTDAF